MISRRIAVEGAQGGAGGFLRHHARIGLAAAAIALAAGPALAQNYGTDARRIGMGGIGERSNLAWDLVPSATPYRSVPVPLGLFQVLGNLDVFNPGAEGFNPVLAMSYAANPMHYTFNRGGSNLGESFVLDIANAGIDPDLNSYRGFIPRSSITARSLVSPGFGKTLWLFDNGYTFHGMYVGAGPYMAFGTDLDFDGSLIDVLAGPTDTYIPNTSFSLYNGTDTQAALAFTGGYRLKLPLPRGGGSTSRDGIYLAANYSHLYGLHYEDFDLAVQFDTDAAGLVDATSPVLIDRWFSSSGKGRSVDLAVAVVVDRWDFTGAIEGMGNHIDWQGVGARHYELTSVTSGGEFVESSLPTPATDLRVRLPIRYSGGATFDAGGWAAGVDVAHGMQDIEFRGGLEYRLGPIDIRGGGRFVRDMWHPTTGVGLNVTNSFGIDVAMLGLASNIEDARETALAVSLRFNQSQ